MKTRQNESVPSGTYAGKAVVLSDTEFEGLPQPVISYGADLQDGEILPFHHHRRAQLVYASQGVITVATREAAYVVPPQRAVWMPAGVEHRIDAHRAVAIRSLYVEPDAARRAPQKACVLQVSPLLRELILSMVAWGNDYDADSPQARLMQVILDQIPAQPSATLTLPMPSDPRLLRITRGLIANPADTRGLADWAQTVGASKRTLNRRFRDQTSMSFRGWRQQCRLLRGLEMLAAGDSVTRVALELGYEHSSAYIAMFRRCLGTTPLRYLQRQE
jgi:AraC-like DNA-binding protein/quercetin dioxygenase-like cupin family protein